MRKAIFNYKNEFITIASNYNGNNQSVEVDEEKCKEIKNALQNDKRIKLKDGEIVFEVNMFKIKEELREKRDKDFKKANIFTEANNWEKLTDEEKQQIDQYKKDLREYVNKINSLEDLENVQYPQLPDIDIGINIY